MKTVLSNRPFPSQTPGPYPSLTESMARHPQGWETAIMNIDLCIKSGMSEEWSEPYGELYRLAKLSPQAWGKLVKEEDHAFKQLFSIGVKVKEWDPLVKPEHGHPLECALSSGNLEAATWLLQASSSPLKAPYLGELLEHARVGKWSIYSWPQNDQVRREFVRTVVERAGPLKAFALNKARDHLPPSMLAELEREVIADTTSITTTSPRSRRL